VKYLNWDNIMLARNRVRLTLWWAIGLLLSASAGAAQAQNLETAKSSVVRIVSPTPEGKPRVGTGFVIKVEDDLAYIVTASHVVEGDPAPQVEFFARRNRLVQASVVKLEGGDPKGIALLMVRGSQNMPPGLPALAFAPSRDVQGGEEVTVIGFGQGQGDWAVIRAHITSVARDFKLDGRIEEGNSGGPVLRDWQVVALVTSVDRGFGLATPSLFVEEILTRWGVSPGARRPAPVPARAPPQATTNRYQLASAGVTVGRVTRQSEKLDLRDGRLTVSDGVQQIVGKFSMTFEQRGTTEVLAVDGGSPVKVRRQIDKASLRVQRELAGNREEQELPGPLQGKTITAARENGVWRVIDAGQELSAELPEDPSMTFDDDWGYPNEPIPVGHQWSLTPEQLGQFLGFTGLNAAGGAASFKFERIVDCGSDQCAQVAAKVRLTGFMPDGSGSQMGITLDGSGTVLRSLRDRIDREAELSGQMEMQQSAQLAGGQVRVTVSGPFTFTGQAIVK
jgi:hypothetical protein